jgi:hypothetical protein
MKIVHARWSLQGPSGFIDPVDILKDGTMAMK